jgi:NAD(P)-dependent dehydrogenase (short-subunit alcohol dehydrogenase family)
MPLKGKTALVTGGAHGIGRAIAVRFAAAGATVAVADLDTTAGADTVARIAELGGRAFFVPVDVGEDESARVAVEQTIAEAGRLDVLVNNAGIGRVTAFSHASVGHWQETLRVNLKGVFLMSKHGLRPMLRADGGAVVNLASVLAVVAEAGSSAYAASKGAVAALTRVMAVDYAPHGIRVNAICPGYVKTRMAEEDYTPETLQAAVTRHPLARMAEPSEIAEAALFLASDRASFVTGSCLFVDGGYTTW